MVKGSFKIESANFTIRRKWIVKVSQHSGFHIYILLCDLRCTDTRLKSGTWRFSQSKRHNSLKSIFVETKNHRSVPFSMVSMSFRPVLSHIPYQESFISKIIMIKSFALIRQKFRNPNDKIWGSSLDRNYNWVQIIHRIIFIISCLLFCFVCMDVFFIFFLSSFSLFLCRSSTWIPLLCILFHLFDRFGFSHNSQFRVWTLNYNCFGNCVIKTIDFHLKYFSCVKSFIIPLK